MAHEIFGNRIALRGEPAWHKIARKIFGRDEAVSATDAFVAADMMYEVRKLPLMAGYELPGGEVRVLDSGLVGLVREPTADDPDPRVLGSASSGYTVFQNRELAELLDPLSKLWPVESAGALKHGALTFVTLDVGMFDILGETVRNYLFCHQGFDGTRGLKIGQTPVREVCWNTLQAGEAAAALSYTIRHVGDVKAQAEWYVNLIGDLRESIQAAQDNFKAMGDRKVTPEEAKAVVDAAYPMPKPPKQLKVATGAASEAMTKDAVKALLAATEPMQRQFDQDRARADSLRVAGYQMYEKLQDEFNRIAGTAWAAYNAVTETSTWREGPNADESVMLGVRADEIGRAYDKAMTLVNA